jgi:hypothetical protein
MRFTKYSSDERRKHLKPFNYFDGEEHHGVIATVDRNRHCLWARSMEGPGAYK